MNVTYCNKTKILTNANLKFLKIWKIINGDDNDNCTKMKISKFEAATNDCSL